MSVRESMSQLKLTMNNYKCALSFMASEFESIIAVDYGAVRKEEALQRKLRETTHDRIFDPEVVQRLAMQSEGKYAALCHDSKKEAEPRFNPHATD